MRDLGHGSYRIRQRPAGQRDMPTGPSPHVRRVATVVPSIVAARQSPNMVVDDGLLQGI